MRHLDLSVAKPRSSPSSAAAHERHFHEIVKGASLAFSVKVVAAGVNFLFNLIVARSLGADGAGLFFLSLTLTTIASVLGRVGLDNTVVRFIAADLTLGDAGRVKALVRKSILVTLTASALCTAVLIVWASWLSRVAFSDPRLERIIMMMSISIVPFSLLNLYSNLHKGIKHVVETLLLASVVVPLFSAVMLVLLRFPENQMLVGGCYVGATLISALLGAWLWRRNRPYGDQHAGKIDNATIFRSCFPLLGIACLQNVVSWSPNIFLGILSGAKSVGFFNLANRTAMLTSFVLMAINSISAPKFAELYRSDQLGALEATVMKSTRLLIAFALPMSLVFFVFPDTIMGLYGRQFREAGPVLSILTVGQFINVATGSVGALLMMCGFEKEMRNNMIFSTAVNLALNVALIPKYGSLGAAVSLATAYRFKTSLPSGWLG
jgi:O-antigen/teichoic acid export membrane protein